MWALLSGSPIIQNGKLIGAITHVLVDDPTSGYAIFAENIPEMAQSVANEQIIPTDEAKRIVDRVCTKYIERFAAHDAVGALRDEKGTVTHENIIICYFDDIKEELLHRICDELLKELNQNAILIQKEYTTLNFYKGQ